MSTEQGDVEALIEEVRAFCLPLCGAKDTKEAQAADYALQVIAALERAERERGEAIDASFSAVELWEAREQKQHDRAEKAERERDKNKNLWIQATEAAGRENIRAERAEREQDEWLKQRNEYAKTTGCDCHEVPFDPDYSAEFQDEYQRLWHREAARAAEAERALAEMRATLNDLAADSDPRIREIARTALRPSEEVSDES